MSDLLTIDNLQLFLTFAVPGIVVVYFRSQFLTGRMPPFSEGLASYVAISLLYQALVFGILIEPSQTGLFDELTKRQWSGLVFALPALIGIALGLNARQGWIAKLLARVKVNTVYPIECAWDWYFSNCGESWVIVRLKDGREWAGVLGGNSFLSSNPSERDLYLERVYFLNEDKSWSEKSSSVWISQGEIQSIEMWPKAKENKNGKGQ